MRGTPPKLILRAHLPDQRAQLYLDLRASSTRSNQWIRDKRLPVIKERQA
jgi:hypothetical protein